MQKSDQNKEINKNKERISTLIRDQEEQKSSFEKQKESFEK